MERIQVGTFGRETGKRDMAFCIVYAKNTQPYINYHEVADPKMVMPTVLMMARWDGKLGFIGGNVDATDNSLKEAVMRELKEEINYIADESRLVPFTTFANEKMNIHAFTYEVTEKELKEIFRESLNAEHFGAENCGSIMMQVHEKSIPNLVKQVWSGTAGTEFKILLEEVLNITV